MKKLRRWEIALLVGVALAALTGSSLGQAQDALAQQVIRLHVVANSDSEADQRVKLLVRDAVLEVTEPLLAGKTRAEAMQTLEKALPTLRQTAAKVLAQQGSDAAVTVSLAENVWFPTKTYANFSLPAGEYTALRVQLGEGAGKNWWCVVFPPLCLGSVSEISRETMAETLTEESVALMTGETEGYVVKFRLVELWEELKEGLR